MVVGSHSDCHTKTETRKVSVMKNVLNRCIKDIVRLTAELESINLEGLDDSTKNIVSSLLKSSKHGLIGSRDYLEYVKGKEK